MKYLVTYTYKRITTLDCFEIQNNNIGFGDITIDTKDLELSVEIVEKTRLELEILYPYHSIVFSNFIKLVD